MESTNLVELVKSVFNQDVLNHAASQLHESKANIEKALDGIIPAVLLRLESKTSSSRSAVLGSVTNASKNILGEQDDLSEGIKNIISAHDDPNGTVQLEKADSILKELFTDRLNPVSEAVSRFSGVSPSSGLRLMSIAAPAIIARLGQSGENTLLQLVPQKNTIINSVPAGLDLKSALGLDNLSQVDQTPTVPRYTDDAQQREPHKVSFVQWVIILVLAGGILFGFYTGCGSNRVGVTTELPPATTTTTNNHQ
ncbi:MAG TPA: DUF937 domain-containing protein [Edaphocola sp.]|nr:DUF937 domain-containing protein [Edaphocola sp.]